MTIKTYREAIIEAMILEMKRDEKVFVIKSKSAQNLKLNS